MGNVRLSIHSVYRTPLLTQPPPSLLQAPSCKSFSGFTLIELSIVLVVIGLIVGITTQASTIVRYAKTRQLLAQVESYRIGVNLFKAQYEQFPGDIDNAANYWSGCGVSSSSAQCNGDGSGTIDTSSDGTDQEMFRFWQHLTLAGILPGTYTGASASGAASYGLGGVNLPPVSYAANISVYPNHIAAGSWTGAQNKPGNFFIIGAEQSGNLPWIHFMKVKDTWALDVKIDDGAPYSGRMMAAHATICTNGTGYTSSNYILSDDTALCMLGFRFP